MDRRCLPALFLAAALFLPLLPVQGGSLADVPARSGIAGGAVTSPLAAPGSQEMRFTCASPVDGSSGSLGPSLQVIYSCPLRVYDGTIGGNAGNPFGNVRLRVDPADPDAASFFSLHGGPTKDGATENSRRGMTHTTFTTTDNGLSWVDSWTTSGYMHGMHGEEAAGTIDRQGRHYIGYLWSAGQNGSASYTMRVWQGPVAEEAWTIREMYDTPGTWLQVDARNGGNKVSEMQLVHVPRPDPPQPPINGTNGTAAPGEVGEDTMPHVSDDRIVLTWHEQAGDLNATPGKSAWIDMMWAIVADDLTEQDWRRLEDEELIGPCRDASDPVAWDGDVYIACAVDRGYDGGFGTKVGDVHIWRFDTKTNTTSYVSDTGLNGDHPRLAVSSDGFFVAMTTRVHGEQRVEVRSSMGWHARQMTPVAGDLGPNLHKALGSKPIIDAHVTALAVMEAQHTAVFVYKEWNEDEATTLPDPNDPLGSGIARLHDFKKVVVSMDACEAPIAGSEFTLGTFVDGYQKQAHDANPGGFNDRQDGLHVVRLPTGEERIFFAINDYGSVQYGGIVGASAMSQELCSAFPPVPPLLPPPAVPAAAALGPGAGSILGVPLAVGAAAMVGYLLLARRKSPDATAAEDR